MKLTEEQKDNIEKAYWARKWDLGKEGALKVAIRVVIPPEAIPGKFQTKVDAYRKIYEDMKHLTTE